MDFADTGADIDIVYSAAYAGARWRFFKAECRVLYHERLDRISVLRRCGGSLVRQNLAMSGLSER